MTFHPVMSIDEVLELALEPRSGGSLRRLSEAVRSARLRHPGGPSAGRAGSSGSSARTAAGWPRSWR